MTVYKEDNYVTMISTSGEPHSTNSTDNNKTWRLYFKAMFRVRRGQTHPLTSSQQDGVFSPSNNSQYLCINNVLRLSYWLQVTATNTNRNELTLGINISSKNSFA